jgi:Cft2 family RNA processing exonuclease
MPVADGIEVEFINAGHLLGSAYARIVVGGRTILFGGDLGRFGRPVLPDPALVTEADYLLVESTYGNRVHEQDDDGEHLARVVRETVDARRAVIIPSFAIGRVEELIYWVKRLEEEKRIPVLPVYVDSPMALAALGRYTARLHELDPELQPEERDEKAPLGRRGPAGAGRRSTPHARGASATCAHSARSASAPWRRARSRGSSSHRRRPRSSSRRAAWPPAAAC